MKVTGPVEPIRSRTYHQTSDRFDPREGKGNNAASSAQTASRPMQVPSAHPAPPSTSMAMLLAVAAANPDREKRRRIAEHGQLALDQLEALDNALALGTVDETLIASLTEWAQQLGLNGPAEVAEIMGEVELRLKVELAKLNRAV